MQALFISTMFQNLNTKCKLFWQMWFWIKNQMTIDYNKYNNFYITNYVKEKI